MITMHVPSGLRRFHTYEDAVQFIKETTHAVKIHRWQDHLQHEDFQDADGTIVAQLEMRSLHDKVEGFEYV